MQAYRCIRNGLALPNKAREKMARAMDLVKNRLNSSGWYNGIKLNRIAAVNDKLRACRITGVCGKVVDRIGDFFCTNAIGVIFEVHNVIGIHVIAIQLVERLEALQFSALPFKQRAVVPNITIQFTPLDWISDGIILNFGGSNVCQQIAPRARGIGVELTCPLGLSRQVNDLTGGRDTEKLYLCSCW